MIKTYRKIAEIDINNLFDYTGNFLSNIAREAIMKAGADLTSLSLFWESLKGKISKKQLTFEDVDDQSMPRKPLRNQKSITNFLKK